MQEPVDTTEAGNYFVPYSSKTRVLSDTGSFIPLEHILRFLPFDHL